MDMPALPKPHRVRADEIAGHERRNSKSQGTLTDAKAAAMIAQAFTRRKIGERRIVGSN
jgi:hypothetical protein